MKEQAGLEHLFGLSLDLICIAGLDGYFKKINPAFTAELGYSEEEILKTPFTEFIHPDDLAATLAEVEKQAQGTPTLYFENRYRRKDGTYIHLAWNAYVAASEGMIYAIARDVTAQKRLQEDLKQSETLYKTLVEGAEDGIILMDTAFNHIYQNPAYSKSLGLTPEEAKMFNPYKNIHPDDYKEMVERGKELFEKGTMSSRYRIRHKDGRWVHRLATSVVLNGPDGKPEKVLAIIRDIDDLESAAQLLRESEERFHLLSDSTFEGIGIVEDGKIVHVNKTVERMFGYGFSELVGMSPLMLSAPEDHMAVRAKLATNDEGAYEVTGVRKDGSRFLMEVQGKKIFHKGKERRVVALHDITEKRKAEYERMLLSAVVEQAFDAVVITGTDGKILYVNPAFEAAFGYGKYEILGRHVAMLGGGGPEGALQKRIFETVKGGRTWSSVLINRKKNGTPAEQQTTISPVWDKSGKISSFTGVYRDVSSEKTLERAKEYFSTITNHELRTPMGKLQLAKLLLERLPGKYDAGAVSEIKGVVEEVYANFDRIVSAISIYAELTEGETMKTFPFDFRQMAAEVVDKAKRDMQKEGRLLSLSLFLDAVPEGTEVAGNQLLIKRAFGELLSNAVKYSRDKSIIKVEGETSAKEVVVTITDEGVGIPRDRIESVFSPFFSLENVRHHSTGAFKFLGGGIGLGLTIAKMIIERHGGSMDVSSRGENSGTRVMVRIPMNLPGENKFPGG